MNHKIGFLGIALCCLLIGCKNSDWDAHYNAPAGTINTNVWDAIQMDADLSKFVSYVKEYHYDTLFQKGGTYSLFAPTNAAFTSFEDSATVSNMTISYLISPLFIQSGSINGKRVVQTLNEKFALFSNTNGVLSLDNIILDFESPLYKNGNYFTMGKVAKPKLNLYEYIAESNPILKAYIDSKDSLILDKALSRPIGIDEYGNTIYDTVAEKYNEFEAKFFPVSKESRFQTATIVFPKEEDYDNALTVMAQSMNLTDYTAIPMIWQQKILIPYLLERGVFYNMVELKDFTTPTSRDTIKMKNILGDSIIINYLPNEKTICSNGYAYNYSNFTIPDTLFKGITRFEAEDLLNEIGTNKFAWYNSVSVTSSVPYSPIQEKIDAASNDTSIKVNFPKGYTGTFTVEFNVNNLFPRKYQMIVRTNTLLGGIYNVYVNDVLVKNFDYYYYTAKKDVYTSVTGKRYSTKSGFNIFDCWVDGILTEYGKAKIKFEYTGPGKVLYNGFSVDCIDFVPF
jgi:hypothetical protein